MRASFQRLSVILAIVLSVSAVWLYFGNLWISYVLKNHFDPMIQTTVADLSLILKDKGSKNKIVTVINKFSNKTRIKSIVLTEKKGKKLFDSRKNAKKDFILSTLYAKYPIHLQDKTIGWIKINPSQEYLYRALFSGYNPLILLFFLLTWSLSTSFVIYFYLHKNILKPINQLGDYLDVINKRIIAKQWFRYEDKHWEELFNKIQRVRNYILDNKLLMNLLLYNSKTVSTTSEIEDIFGKVLDIVINKYETPCAIITLGEDGFFKSSARRGFSPGFIEHMRLKKGEGIVGKTYEDKKVIIINNMNNSRSPYMQHASDEGVRSFMYTPIICNDTCIGVLGLGSQKENFFTSEITKYVAFIADYLSAIVQNSNIHRHVSELNTKIETEISSTTQELINTNSRLIKKASELERLNKSKNEFITMLSNDISVPVLAIEGFVKLVLSGKAGTVNTQQKKFLTTSLQSIERLTRLMSNFVELSKIETSRIEIKLSKLSFNKLLDEVLTDITDDIEQKKIKIVKNIQSNLPTISGDKEKLLLLLSNLILNAIRFSFDSGTVSIDIKKEGNAVNLMVADNGIGIKKEELPRVFDKFHKRDSILSRTIPLSFALCKSIVKLHNGKIWVNSDIGKGTSSVFAIPFKR
ncbi:ATP-binding protein [Elusimicrobiota bacterium]